MGTATTSPARSKPSTEAVPTELGGAMRMLPLILVFAILAAGIGYALA